MNNNGGQSFLAFKFFLAACPDSSFDITEAVALQEDGTVAGSYKFGGTHTGVPLTCKNEAGEMAAPVEATSKAVRNDLEKAVFTFIDGKVVDLLIVPGEGTTNHGIRGWYGQVSAK